MAPDPDNFMFKWFRELVKHKMSAIAIPIAGISVAVSLLTFSKLFDFPIGNIIAGAGLCLMLFMLGLFAVSATILVVRNLHEPPKKPPNRRMDGRLIEKPKEDPMPVLVQSPAADLDLQARAPDPKAKSGNGS